MARYSGVSSNRYNGQVFEACLRASLCGWRHGRRRVLRSSRRSCCIGERLWRGVGKSAFCLDGAICHHCFLRPIMNVMRPWRAPALQVSQNGNHNIYRVIAISEPQVRSCCGEKSDSGGYRNSWRWRRRGRLWRWVLSSYAGLFSPALAHCWVRPARLPHELAIWEWWGEPKRAAFQLFFFYMFGRKDQGLVFFSCFKIRFLVLSELPRADAYARGRLRFEKRLARFKLVWKTAESFFLRKQKNLIRKLIFTLVRGSSYKWLEEHITVWWVDVCWMNWSGQWTSGRWLPLLRSIIFASHTLYSTVF